ncbi:MAG: adenylyl-sulfate kinase [Desulfomonile tiedjei]|nr:adenylyl-sulfate kinase [Desulfomonile tiedjei]
MQWHSGKTIWFTGLSGSGKSTVSSMVKNILESRGVSTVLLDGDMLRSGLNRDLGFSAADRAENIRRAGEVAKILSDAGHTVLAAFITPLESLRRAVRGLFEPGRYVEVFLECPLSVCETRDVKGLYCRARSGEIPEFTGISSPFEIPVACDLTVPTGEQTVEESVNMTLGWLENRFPDLRLSCSPWFGGSRPRRKVVVIGLDSVAPALVFGEAGKDLPNLRALMGHGIWGPLASTDPPITIPAWTTMTTGKDPGELGFYGFRNRADYGYGEMFTVNDSHVETPRVWDYLEDVGLSSILIGIPQTYPPRAHQGITIAGVPLPDVETPSTYPADVAPEVARAAGGEYLADVKDFRTADKDRLLGALYDMVNTRFSVARDFLVHKPWNFFMMVEIAPDRLHHGFWRYFNPDHRLYQPGNPYESAVRLFYNHLDSCIGSLLAVLEDDTTVLVVSDHGARNLVGAVCINEWLIQNEFLVLHRQPDSECPLTPEIVDWTRTKAWGEGGYCGRIFLNVSGREPQGVIKPEEYEQVRDELAQRLQAMKGENGRPLANQVLKPEDIYRSCRNIPPDLMVYFDDLNRRSVSTVGHGKVFQSGNATGLDDANHDRYGIFIAARMWELRKGLRKGKQIQSASCLDITPTILHEFGLTVPSDLAGRVITIDGADYAPAEGRTNRPAVRDNKAQAMGSCSAKGYTSEEEEVIKKRLMELGYL